jgi:hypothetical protein
MSSGLAIGFSSGSLTSGTVLDVSGNTHVSGVIDAGALQINGSDISDLYASITPTQLRYTQTTNLGADTTLANHTSIVMLDGITPSTLTLTLPKVNNIVGIQIVILNLTAYSLTVATSSGIFKGGQSGVSSYTMGSGGFNRLIGYYNGELLGYFWYVMG